MTTPNSSKLVGSTHGDMTDSKYPQIMGRTLGEWFFSLPVFALLLLTLIIGTGEMVHGQLLRLGETMFGDQANQVQYFMLRAEPVKPSCNANMNVDEELARQNAAAPAANDDIDDLFGSSGPKDPAVARHSLEQSIQICQAKHDLYTRILAHQTPEVKIYRTIETSFFGLFQIGTENRPLILLLMVALSTIITTVKFHHIALRPARFTRDNFTQSLLQAVSSGLLLYSSYSYYQILKATGIHLENEIIHFVWMALFVAMLARNLKRVVVPVVSPEGDRSWTKAGLADPLYSTMAIIGGVYFLLHDHPAGLAIYINQLMELPTIFLNLGLFIWSGMLLKQSRIVDLFMDLLRPWRLSPQLLTYIILLAAAVPTAYTGASGLFVIAAGGIIYHEVRASGGTRQFALAATAMSGSLGVVLRPCLLVVLIAAMNKQVTTNGLYHWGVYVFLLTSTLFFLASQVLRTKRANIETFNIAIPATLRAIVPTLPYVAVVFVVVFIYEYVLDTKLNEITAP